MKLILCFPGSGKCYFFTNFLHRHGKIFTFFIAVWKGWTESQACWKSMGGLTSAWFNKLNFWGSWRINGCEMEMALPLGSQQTSWPSSDSCSVLSCLILFYSDSSCSAWVRRLCIYPSCFLTISGKKLSVIFC